MRKRAYCKAYLLIGTRPIKSVCKGLLEWEKITGKWRYSVTINGVPVFFPNEFTSMIAARCAMQAKVDEIRRKYCKEGL